MTNKKIAIGLGIVAFFVAAGLFYSSWTDFASRQGEGSNLPVAKPAKEKDPGESQAYAPDKLYADAAYGFKFRYPAYMDVEARAAEIPPTDLGYVDVNMRTLSGLGPILKFRVTDSRDGMFLKNIKSSEQEVLFGNRKATRIDWGVAGGEFVTFEIPLERGRYLYVETDKHFVDRQFSDMFKGTEREELIRAANGFWQIHDSLVVHAK